MDRAERIVEWDGRNMGEGLDAGRLEIAFEETGAGVHRVGSARLRTGLPAEPSVMDGPLLWSPSLVEARLRRAGEIFKAMQRDPDVWPMGHRSCMPTPILDRARDYAPDVVIRVRPSHEEITLAERTFDWKFEATFNLQDVTRAALAEAVAFAVPWRKVSKILKLRPDAQSLSFNGAKARAVRLMVEIASLWTAKEREFDDLDIAFAEALHRAGRSVIH